MNSQDHIQQLIHQRLTHRSAVSEGLQSEALDPKDLTTRWLNKESEFKFLEELVTLSDPITARELLFSFKEIDQLLESIDTLREEREQDDVDPLPQHFYDAAQSVAELEWVETLFEEELLEGDDPTLLTMSLQAARELTWRVIHELCERHQLDPIFQALPCDEPSAQRAEARWVCEQRLSSLEPRYSARWRALSSPELIEAAIEEVMGGLKTELAERSAAWGARCEEAGLSCSPSLWRAQLVPVATRWATQHVTALFMRAISEDVADLFERLASAERPRDHRVGSLMFGGARGEDVTVIFTKRDGHILAQRQVTWDPEQPEEVCDAFREIKIRTLVAPDEVPEHIERALEQLCERYQVARISTVGTVEVKRPHNLTEDAQVALQLAQRYVAPLRYWARADLAEIAKVSLEPHLFEQLMSAPHWRALYERALKVRVDLAWVRLRGLRQQRSARTPTRAPQRVRDADSAQPAGTSSGEPAQEEPKAPSSPAMRRGEQVDVKLTEVSPFRLKGEVHSGPQRGREVLISLSGSRELIERSFRVGERLRASVIHDHPKQPHAHLTLRALGGPTLDTPSPLSGAQRAHSAARRSSPRPSRASSAQPAQQRSDSETLQTLNALFKKSSR